MGAVVVEAGAVLLLQADLRASHPANHHPSAGRREIHRQADLHGNQRPSADGPHGGPAADPFWRATYFGRHGR